LAQPPSPSVDTTVFAHRGASQAVAEHTIGAYRLALAEGADGFECDVGLSADGELVCLHDRTLERTGGSTNEVSTMTLEQLRAVDWGLWKHGTAPDRDPETGQLMTLRELIELAFGAGRPIGLAIETKHPARFGGKVEEELAALLWEYDLAGARREGQTWARMMSFSESAVSRMSAMCPDLPTVLLIRTPIPLPNLAGVLPEGVGTAGLDMHILRDHPEVVSHQHDAGHDVFAWTVDDDEDIRLCLELGVDGIISNRPGHVLEVAGRRR
jgi:glycerophosphoryl diester phosphodiesterase